MTCCFQHHLLFLLATTRTTTGSTTTPKNNNRIHNNRNNCRWCVSFLVQHSTSANLEEASCLEAGGVVFICRAGTCLATQWINMFFIPPPVLLPPPQQQQLLEHVRITSTPQLRASTIYSRDFLSFSSRFYV